MGSPSSTSDPHFAAIEATAAETDRLAAALTGFEATLNNLNGNVLILKSQQDELIREQEQQSAKLDRIESSVKTTASDLDEIKAAVMEIRQSIGGVVSLAKSALDEATKKRRSIRPPKLRVAAGNGT